MTAPAVLTVEQPLPKETWALVCESGWVHAVHNVRHNTDRAAVSRSVPLDQVDPEKGLHHYTVVRYVAALDLGRADASELEAERDHYRAACCDALAALRIPLGHDHAIVKRLRDAVTAPPRSET